MNSTTNSYLRSLVKIDEGILDRRIFWEESIYRLELKKIFARCWLFIGHESQIAKPGDFVATYMGEDAVLLSRSQDGSIHVMLNSCTHRGNKVCFAEEGNRRRFTCNYHGWSFGNDGALLGMPAEDLYEKTCPNFDKKKLGLLKAKVGTYNGLIFATFDQEAISLEDYLGNFKWYLDILLDNDEGGTEFLPGNIKSRISCNWKFPAENFCGDSYHAAWTHNSGAIATLGQAVGKVQQDITFAVNEQGHGWQFGLDMIGNALTLGEQEIIDYLKGRQEKMEKRLGILRTRMVAAVSSANIFPHFAFLPGHNSFRTWHPKGPMEIELHTWVLVNRDAPDQLKELYRKGAMRTFSPSGVFEMDDGENWENCSQVNRGYITGQQTLHYGLGLNSAISHEELPGNIFRGKYNDANQRSFYKRWLELMTAD